MAIQDGFSFNDAEYPHFDPEEYWGSREFKVWVVTLRHVTRRNHFGREKICGIGVRLATPTDLGAVPSG